MIARNLTAALFAQAFSVALGALASASPAEVERFEAVWPAQRLWVGAEGVEGITIRAIDAEGALVIDHAKPLAIRGLSATASVATEAGVAAVPAVRIDAHEIAISDGTVSTTIEVPVLSGWLALLPAVLAIVLALATREVLLSLFGGVWLGAMLLHHSFFLAFPRSLDLVARTVADADKVKIIVFTMLMGGLVGIITSTGGTTGLVAAISRRARTPRSGAIATWMMGLLVFFDDYASTLLLGTTMRPITDRLGISREKLSYIVDSTAAPVASLALVSTWIGYEVSVLGDALRAAGIERDAYEVFLSGLPSRFYQLFALAFVFILAWFGRDFGPMLKAERRALREGKLIRDGGSPLMDAGLMEEAGRLGELRPRWWLAVVPIAVLVSTVLIVLVSTGLDAAAADPAGYASARAAGAVRALGYVLSNAASYDALLYAGAASGALAFVLGVSVRACTVKQALEAFVRGLRAMILAVVVLCLAWSIGKVMEDLRAGTFVAELIGDQLPPWSLGAVTFLLAAGISFATGTSWGTMAILFPIVLPVVALHAGAPGFESVLLGSSSAILAGSVFGDHCSPISDTTVLSSIASASDHVDHTQTQAPYALVCAAAAIVFGYIPYGFGMSPWLSLATGLASLVLLVRFAGARP